MYALFMLQRNFRIGIYVERWLRLEKHIMHLLSIQLSNIHCGDCEETIVSLISKYFELVRPTQNVTESSVVFDLSDNKIIELKDNRNRIKSVTKKVIKSLKGSGFDVQSWQLYIDEKLDISSKAAISESAIKLSSDEDDGAFRLLSYFSRRREKKLIDSHLKHCKKCQDDLKGSSSSSDEEVKFVIGHAPQEYRAVFTIAGMTCASCTQAVGTALSDVMKANGMATGDDKNPSYSVNLLQHTAVAIVTNKQIVNKFVDAIGDIGFDCQLVEILPVQRSTNTKVNAIIGGMTCAACVNTIESAIKDLPFVLESGINVVTKTGQFVMEDEDNENVEQLKATIEDCGYDFEVTSKETINYTLSKKKSRTINVSVENMFCNHCPDVVTSYLTSFGDTVVIQDPITLKHPFIKFTYLPNLERNINLRRFLFDLNHLHPTDNEPGYKIVPEAESTFKCTYIEQVSVDEHLRKLTRKETRSIFFRLVLATVIAVPTLIFGIVAMSLLPKSHSFRRWIEEPIWTGNVSRVVWILLFLSTPVYFFAADIFHRKTLKELRALWFNKSSWHKRFFQFGSMNMLMTLGTSIAYFSSIVLLILSSQQKPDSHMGLHTTYFDSVVFLTFFLLIGRLLESYSKSKTADAISLLNSFKATEATLVELRSKDELPLVFQNETRVNVKLLEIDDYIKIASGESPPVDCVVVSGESSFDESALTGESLPVKHIVGHQIFSGTVNVGHSSIVAKITSLEGGSLIDQIVDTVRNGQMRKAPIEKTADIITGYFVPVITVLAVITWIIWLALGHSGALPAYYLDIDIGGWTVWSMEFALAVFVIACPCGIGLAAPTALFVGSGLAAKHGILAKGGGVAFQDGAKVNVVCFDKTGTLTNGALEVTDHTFLQEDKILRNLAVQLSKDLEVSSNHPISDAITTFTNQQAKKLNFSFAANITPQVDNVPGKGLRAKIRIDEQDTGKWGQLEAGEAVLGNELLFKDSNVDLTPIQDTLEGWKSERKSVVLVGLQSVSLFGDERYHLLMAMACRDDIRIETKAVISYLQNKRGIECWMISGDNKQTAEAIGVEIGLKPERIISEVVPQDKEAQIKKIQSDPLKIVAMVGDGINDAPSLATAQVGIALSSGADLAVTSSDFILLSKHRPLEALVTLLDLSRVVFNRVRFNFGWALVYNMIGLPIAAGVIYPYHQSRLNPVWASAAMAASSVSVVLSSLALKLWRPKHHK